LKHIEVELLQSPRTAHHSTSISTIGSEPIHEESLVFPYQHNGSKLMNNEISMQSILK